MCLPFLVSRTCVLEEDDSDADCSAFGTFPPLSYLMFRQLLEGVANMLICYSLSCVYVALLLFCVLPNESFF